ncbi:hypothetical protein BMS3Abin15_00216 [bacterium BMS3Abin15]|nr:hypothetical protein BMS3Abin15_00216 [bacterium BMS3Abin15]
MSGPVLTEKKFKKLEEERNVCICLSCDSCHKKVGEGCGQCEFPETDEKNCASNCYDKL